jgi:membrane-associated phospholipid phosphatase
VMIDATVAAEIREIRHRMFERRLHALIAGVVLLVIALILGIIIAVDPASSIVQGIDDRWLRWMVSVRTSFWTRVAKDVSAIGAIKVTLPLRLLVSAVLAWRRRWLQLGAFVGAVITSELCIGPVKALVDRPRPPNPLIGTSAASFPSGHAIAGAVTAFGLVVVLLPASPRRWMAIGFAAAFAGLMAISRTMLSAHWLTDTIAGACIGTGLALVWPAALELLRERHGRRAMSNEPVMPNEPVMEDGL